ncbi:MAG: hypothetical protein AAFZ04_00910 [Pseudomonadota bacterium]
MGQELTKLKTLTNRPPEVLGREVRRVLAGRPDLAAAIRQQIFKPLHSNGDTDRATSVNAALIFAQPWRGDLRLDQLAVGVSSDRETQITAACDAMAHTAGPDGQNLTSTLKSLLREGHAARAAQLLIATEPHWPETTEFLLLAMKAFYRSGAYAEASAMATRLARHNQLTVDQGIDLAIAANAMRDFETSKAALVTSGAETSDNALALALLAQAQLATQEDSAQVTQTAERAVALADQNARPLAIIADVLDRVGQTDRALSILQNLPSNQITRAVRARRAHLLARTGDHASAADDYGALSSEEPDNRPVRRKWVGALVHAGQMDEARRVYDDGLTRRRQHLAPTFAQAMAALASGDLRSRIPEHRLHWCETHLDIDPQDSLHWRQDAERTMAIDQLFLDWAECHPDRIAEIHPFVSISDNAKALLQASKRRGKGGFVTSAHVGVLYAGPVALEMLDLHSSWIASMPALPGSVHDARLISTETNRPSHVVRATLSALEANHHIAVAIDGAAGQAMTHVPFLGSTIALSDFCAHVCYKVGCTAFFPIIHWSGTRVEIDLIAMPEPSIGEDLRTYGTRWLRVFAQHLEKMLIAMPGAIRGCGGFWRDVANGSRACEL